MPRELSWPPCGGSTSSGDFLLPHGSGVWIVSNSKKVPVSPPADLVRMLLGRMVQDIPEEHQPRALQRLGRCLRELHEPFGDVPAVFRELEDGR